MLYVDDTNLWARLEEEEDLDGTLVNSQLGINDFGEALQATGGQQNMNKCAFMVHDMRCTNKCKWVYTDTPPKKTSLEAALEYSGLEDIQLTIP